MTAITQARARQTVEGSRAERTTSSALSVLREPHWVVFDDVVVPGARGRAVGHIVVGPPGVFVIDAINLSGHVALQGGVLKQNGKNRSQLVTSLHGVEPAMLGVVPGLRPDHVHLVACLVGGDHVRGAIDDIAVCSPLDIVQVMASRPSMLSESDIAIVAQLLRAGLNTGTVAASYANAPTTPAAGVAPPTPPPSAPRGHAAPGRQRPAAPRTAPPRAAARGGTRDDLPQRSAVARPGRERRRSLVPDPIKYGLAGAFITLCLTSPQTFTEVSHRIGDVFIDDAVQSPAPGAP
ncbi:nuclease-related domain-containing protein [Nocardioides sp. R-C-SC26]|uniref:nuclease-related domain-containing protein n=1 Tax=Nocardioides sp. R-C-SC26 TaxID=2870414 RepID=UPI001E4D99FE|nr:nuclease-related domain-containing protein [Nocardioides sp. R-C-SC26]